MRKKALRFFMMIAVVILTALSAAADPGEGWGFLKTETSAGEDGSTVTTWEKRTVAKKKKNKKKNKQTSSSQDSDSKNKETASSDKDAADQDELKVEEDGEYTSKEEVALYIHEFGKLPSNYITKKEAQKLGWDSREGNLDEVAPGKSIGGDYFGNYEEILPTNKKYHECDIDFDGGYRGSKRIIYSDDGDVYYTEDHYKTFEKLY